MSNLTQLHHAPNCTIALCGGECLIGDPLPVLGTMQCSECHRTFDPTDEVDAEEWAYGHDCEEQS